MEGISKILVPTDFSTHASQALHFAVDMARRYEASIDLIHVFETFTYILPDGYVFMGAENFDLLMDQFRKQLETARQSALELGAKVVETTLLQGSPSQEIVRCAKDRNSDLIIMGTHGRQGINHFLIGSVAERVVRTAPCPVLTVRSKA